MANLIYSPTIGEVVPTVLDVGFVRIVMAATVVAVVVFFGTLRRVVVG